MVAGLIPAQSNSFDRWPDDGVADAEACTEGENMEKVDL